MEPHFTLHFGSPRPLAQAANCFAWVTMGDSRKYLYLYHGRLLGFPKGRGFFELEFRRNRGVFMIRNLKAWGDFTGGISGVERGE